MFRHGLTLKCFWIVTSNTALIEFTYLGCLQVFYTGCKKIILSKNSSLFLRCYQLQCHSNYHRSPKDMRQICGYFYYLEPILHPIPCIYLNSIQYWNIYLFSYCWILDVNKGFCISKSDWNQKRETARKNCIIFLIFPPPI